MMHIVAPPEPPMLVALGDDDQRRRIDGRLWQIWLTLLTVLATAWLCTLGPIPGVLAVVTAKHVLVAILAMGLSIDAPRSPMTNVQ